MDNNRTVSNNQLAVTVHRYKNNRGSGVGLALVTHC